MTTDYTNVAKSSEYFFWFRNNIRIQDLWQYSDSVKELACHPKIMDTLKMLYEREPVPFQTLNFKVGTQQKAHSDTLHFSSLPARYMCGVWVALEDITEDNGPLFYYPGSHRNPEYNFSDFKNLNFKKYVISLRLGKNLNYCYMSDTKQPHPTFF